MKKWLTFLLLCLHINSWMLVPHVQHNTPSFMYANNTDNLDSFFEFVDEVVLSHVDQTPDQEENDGELLDQLGKHQSTENQFLSDHMYIKLEDLSTSKKIFHTVEYKHRISQEIIAPPPDLI